MVAALAVNEAVAEAEVAEADVVAVVVAEAVEAPVAEVARTRTRAGHL